MVNDSVSDLLDFDAKQFAYKLGLVSDPGSLSTPLAVSLLNEAERLSRGRDRESKRKCLLICGLIWEHRQGNWLALGAHISLLLSRIGLNPSVHMVNSPDGDGRLSALGSLRDELTFVARSLPHEIAPAGGPLLLSEFQARAWHALRTFARVGISAPTSAGKSFVLAHHVVDLLCNKRGSVVYVVPTVSLVHQVTTDLRKLLNRAQDPDTVVLQTYTGNVEAGTPRAYILTQERLATALNDPHAMMNLDLAVFDEIQNVERVAWEANDRSRTLLEVLSEVVWNRSPRQVAICGPQLANMGQLTSELLGSHTETVVDELPPVLNVTYSFSKERTRYVLKQYSPAAGFATRITLERPYPGAERIIGLRQYDDDAIDGISALSRLLEREGGALVFAPNSGQAEKIAMRMAETRGRTAGPDGLLDELGAYLRSSVHAEYSLAECVGSRVAFHHGKVPHHVRLSAQSAFSAGQLSTIVCTTTLLQGVNLPAKTLIARSPDLFVKRRSDRGNASLSHYEFANLRGRAGRLLKDFVGRAVVLDEAAFGLRDNMFDFPLKTVESGFRTRFEESRDAIVEDLLNAGPYPTSKQTADIVSFVRHSVLRHGADAARRLARAGISLRTDELHKVVSELSFLSVPVRFVYRLPAWDPLLLDRMYDAFKSGALPSLPQHPRSFGCAASLRQAIQLTLDWAPERMQSVFRTYDDDRLNALTRRAVDYALEAPLAVLVARGLLDPDRQKIERRIESITKMITFELPRLLQPLAVFEDKSSSILGFIETGASQPLSLQLLSLGLPREVTLSVVGRVPDLVRHDLAASRPRELVGYVSNMAQELSVWERRILEECFPPSAEPSSLK